MAAAFMLLQVHDWGIHAVSTARRARAARHGSAPGTHEHHGPQPDRRHPLKINLRQAALSSSDRERGINAERPDTSDAVVAEVLNAPARPGARAAGRRPRPGLPRHRATEPSSTALSNTNTPAPPG
jgi:hypothetical protein